MKTFSLEYFFEPLMDDPSYFTKKMFGGLAVYFGGLMVAVISESIGDREWKGVTYSYDIWNGVLFCTSREHHDSLNRSFPSFKSHPILGKWLYLPMSEVDFEAEVVKVVKAISQFDERIGIVPGTKKKKSKKKKRLSKKKVKK